MNPIWYPGYYLDPKNMWEWMPDLMDHWLATPLVRTPPEIPPASWPEPSSKPSYGLLDDLAERLRPKSLEERLAALPTLLPDVVATPTASQTNSSLWGGLLPLDLASQPAQWPDVLPVSMPPSMPTAESSPPPMLGAPRVVPTLGGGPPARIAGWPRDVPGDVPVLPVQHMESANYWGTAPTTAPGPPPNYYLAPMPPAPDWDAAPVVGTPITPQSPEPATATPPSVPSWLPGALWSPVAGPVPTQSEALSSFIQGALTPFTSYPATYAQMNREASALMNEGFEQAKEAAKARRPTSGGPLARPTSSKGDEFLTGLGKAALGAVEYASSPINAAVRTIMGQPIEAVSGIPKEYTEFAASLWPPKLAIPIGMSAVKFFPRYQVKVAEAMEAAGHSWRDIVRETGLYRGAEGKWRFELSDKGYRVRPNAGTLDEEGFRVAPLFEHHDHPALRQAYPHFAVITSRLKIDPNGPRRAHFDPDTNTLTIHARSVKEAEEIGIHDLTHPIQKHEGHARGGSVWEFLRENPNLSDYEAYQLYGRLGGEVEGEATRARLGMSEKERRIKPFRETEEEIFPRTQQIIRY